MATQLTEKDTGNATFIDHSIQTITLNDKEYSKLQKEMKRHTLKDNPSATSDKNND